MLTGHVERRTVAFRPSIRNIREDKIEYFRPPYVFYSSSSLLATDERTAWLAARAMLVAELCCNLACTSFGIYLPVGSYRTPFWVS